MSKKTVHTLEDIARLANVSRSTVSRALNNSPLISKETRERIQAIAVTYDFRINVPARNLRLQQSRTIAFVTPDYCPQFFSSEDLFGLGILMGVGNGLRELEYDLLIIHINPDDSTWVHQYLDSGRVDGFILLATNLRPELLQTLEEAEAPFIVWGLPLPGYSYCTVSGDNVTGGRLATRHLIDLGCKMIAFLGGEPSDLTVQNRFKGYQVALQEAGRQLEPCCVTYGDYSFASGKTAMQHLLDQAPELDAVFVNSDLMAIAAISVIQESGKRVPEDIAVVGYDDLSIAEYNNLPLTTIRQNVPLAGKLLAQNLVAYIQSGAVTHMTTPVELVIRRSA